MFINLQICLNLQNLKCISQYALQKFIKIFCDIMLVDFELSFTEYNNILIIRGHQLQRKFFASLFITLGIISTCLWIDW